MSVPLSAAWKPGQMDGRTVRVSALDSVLFGGAQTARPQRAPTRTPHIHSRGKQQFSAPELQALWIQAGGDPAKANIAAAIALAESGGRTGPGVHSSNPAGGINRGPWQIWSGNPGSSDDPLTNAKTAVRMSKNGTNWGSWETYATGAYKKFLGSGVTQQDQSTTFQGGSLKGAVSDTAGQIGRIADVFGTAGNFLLTQQGWRRILKVVIGGVVIIYGITLLAKNLAGVDVAAPLNKAAGGVTKGVVGKS